MPCLRLLAALLGGCCREVASVANPSGHVFPLAKHRWKMMDFTWKNVDMVWYPMTKAAINTRHHPDGNPPVLDPPLWSPWNPPGSRRSVADRKAFHTLAHQDEASAYDTVHKPRAFKMAQWQWLKTRPNQKFNMNYEFNVIPCSGMGLKEC